MSQTDKLTHKDVKELAKHDVFRERTIETIEYVSEHKGDLYKYIGLGVVVVALIAGFFWYRGHQHSLRQEALQNLLNIYNATVTGGGQAPPFAAKTYNTEGEKTQAIRSEFSKFAEANKGTNEGAIAAYYLGVNWAESGNGGEAEKWLTQAGDEGDNDYRSLAKITLAQFYSSQGKEDQALKLIQQVMDHPSAFISKEHATIEKARVLMKSNPAEARKLLEPLRTARAAISQVALQLLSNLK